MRAWLHRSPEIAHLFNPAFCALLLSEFVLGFTKEAKHPVQTPLLFLPLPIVLHRQTRKALPKTVATKHHIWLEQHQFLRVGFAERCRSLVPYIKESTIFACQTGLLQFTENGDISRTTRRLKRDSWDNSSETSECIAKTKFVGRWLAHAGSASTIYALWGISP